MALLRDMQALRSGRAESKGLWGIRKEPLESVLIDGSGSQRKGQGWRETRGSHWGAGAKEEEESTPGLGGGGDVVFSVDDGGAEGPRAAAGAEGTGGPGARSYLGSPELGVRAAAWVRGTGSGEKPWDLGVRRPSSPLKEIPAKSAGRSSNAMEEERMRSRDGREKAGRRKVAGEGKGQGSFTKKEDPPMFMREQRWKAGERWVEPANPGGRKKRSAGDLGLGHGTHSAPAVPGGSQAGDRSGAAAARDLSHVCDLHRSHSHARSEPHL